MPPWPSTTTTAFFLNWQMEYSPNGKIGINRRAQEFTSSSYCVVIGHSAIILVLAMRRWAAKQHSQDRCEVRSKNTPSIINPGWLLSSSWLSERSLRFDEIGKFFFRRMSVCQLRSIGHSFQTIFMKLGTPVPWFLSQILSKTLLKGGK